MAVTITAGELAVAIRAATDADSVAPEIAAVLALILPAATNLVTTYAPGAPDAMHNMAAVRVGGWLYDADPTDPGIGRAMDISGARAMLSQWRTHRAGAIGTGEAPGPAPAPTPTPGAGLPPLPAAGNFVLTVNDGVLAWVAFPQP
ncbi:MAG: hypothetical protein OXI07_09015 [Gammaproteobacteria bacterium]|nr:hypothetical protein [Gammaproteobacteria bacterium]